MKAKSACTKDQFSLTRTRRRLAAGAALLGLGLLCPALIRAGGVVSNCTESDLRAAMAGGGTVTFACDGTIALSHTITNSTDTVLDGTGRQIIISGGYSDRCFLNDSNSVLTLVNLTIANGSASAGGGIYNSGSLNLERITFETNEVTPANDEFDPNNLESGCARGGAICNAGSVSASRCLFSRNQAQGFSSFDGSYSPAYGGAIFSGYTAGPLNVTRCTFAENRAIGGDGPDAVGYGVGLPDGGDGTSAYGGAICSYGPAVIATSLFCSNSAVGGKGGRGGDSAVGGYSAGSGGFGGVASGGAVLCVDSSEAVNCTFVSNVVVGGSGGDGGNQLDPYGYLTGDGGWGNQGEMVLSAFQVTHCTIAFNTAIPGVGGAPGSSYFGSGDPGGSQGFSFGGVGGVFVINTLLASNSFANCSPYVFDLGHNLSSDGALTNTSSFTNLYPKLGPLANHGGPTLTMALLPGSPAIDAADPSAAPLTDQRGYPRPAGAGPDIGAFEYGSLSMSASPSGSSGLDILVRGDPNQWCRLLSGSDLNSSAWNPVATNQIGPDGVLVFPQDCDVGGRCRFYRVVQP